MFVKICGTTSLSDAELAIASGADAVGFVFAPSKRRVSVEQVSEITAKMPYGIERIGVFSAPDAGEILRAVKEARLTAVQLHFPQNPGLLTTLASRLPEDVRIWQVVSYETQTSGASKSFDPSFAERQFLEDVLAAMTDTRISAVLLDTSKAGTSGGTGQTFPWKRAAPLVVQARMLAAEAIGKDSEPIPVILAGGLRAENVAEAIRVFGPWGVDCVSGVEAEPGRKDRSRLEAFVRAAHGER